MTSRSPDDNALSPTESATIIAAQRTAVHRSLEPSSAYLLGIWAVAWTLGYLDLWLHYAGRIPGAPPWVAGTIFGLLMLAGLGATAWHIARRTRGILGHSSLVGAGYGLAWMLGWFAIMVLGIALAKVGTPDDAIGLYWSLAPAMFVGVMYLTGALIWPEWEWFAVGALITASTIAAAFAGPVTCLLVMCLAGGGSMAVGAVVAGVVARRRVRQSPRAVAGQLNTGRAGHE